MSTGDPFLDYIQGGNYTTDAAGNIVLKPGADPQQAAAAAAASAVRGEEASGTFLGGLFGDLLGGIMTNIGPIASTAGGLASLMGAYNRLGAIGERGLVGAGQIAEEAFARSQFKPFTVTTGTGSSVGVGVPAPGSFPQMDEETRLNQLMNIYGISREEAMAQQRGVLARGFDINNDGVVSGAEFAAARNAGLTGPGRGGDAFGQGAGVATGAAGGAGGALTGAGPMIGPNIQTTYSPLEQAISQGAFTGAQTLLGGVAGDQAAREQEIFDRIRATQLAEEERQRLALEERLASQGRLGVQTAMFGGTPEQLALAKAQEEAQARASLAAIQQAQAEQEQQARLGTQLLGAAYLPEAQAQNALQRGLLASQLAQRGQLYGTGLFGEASIAGLDALLGSGIGQAELMGRLGTGLLSGAIQGSGGGQGGIGDIVGDLVAEYGPQAINYVKGLFSDARLKENIQKIGVSPNGFNVYTWDWNEDGKRLAGNTPSVGVIAQEVEQVIPDAVSIGAEGYLLVDYSQI